MRHCPTPSVLLHPVAALHASAVHAFPSSHDCVAPPPVQAPDTHVFADVNHNSAHVPAPHVAPSGALLQPVLSFAVAHTRHRFDGSSWASPKHTPPIRHEPAWSAFVHPVAAAHASAVHAFPSLQSCVPPPPVQTPDAHVFARIHASPAHDAATHVSPSPASVQPDGSFAASQDWHGFAGFPWPSP